MTESHKGDHKIRIWQSKNPGPYGCQHVTEMYAEYIGMCDDCHRDRVLNSLKGRQ